MKFSLSLALIGLTASANAYCNGRDSGCRNIIEGDGDCDRHNDCKSGLKCGKDNCFRGRGSPFDRTDDCCYNPRTMSRTARYSMTPYNLLVRQLAIANAKHRANVRRAQEAANARARARRAANRARIAKAKAARLAREAKARATRIAKARAIRAAAAARIAKAKAIRDARIAKAKALAAHRRRIVYRHHNNIFNRNIRSSKTWYSYIRSNTAHFRHTSAMRAHRNKMVAKYFAARNHAGRWASIRNHRWAVARKNRGVMNKTRKTATWWSRHVANMNRIRIAKSKYHTAMRNKQRSHARWGVAHVRNAQRQRSSWNRKWAGVVARASKANRAALIAYHKANAQKSKAWKGYHASNASYMRHLKAYRLSVKNLSSAHSRKAYWLKKARVSHHKLVSYVRSGAGRGYFH